MIVALQLSSGGLIYLIVVLPDSIFGGQLIVGVVTIKWQRFFENGAYLGQNLRQLIVGLQLSRGHLI